jgi:phage replication O-like protein O
MSVFRELIRAAIEKDLGKNDLKVFIVLLEQTLGYGKKTDRLTDRRLAHLCEMRLDRFRLAAQVVVNKGLFEQRPAKMFQYRYTISERFLSKHIEKHGDQDFFTPALPKKRPDSQKTETVSEKKRHTALDLDPSLSSLLQPLQTLLSFSTDMLQQQMQQQERFINTLLQTQQQAGHSSGISIAYPACNTHNTQNKPTAAPPPTVVNMPLTTETHPTHIHLSEAHLGHINLHLSHHPSDSLFLKTEPKTDNPSEKASEKQSVSRGHDDDHLNPPLPDTPPPQPPLVNPIDPQKAPERSG